MVDHILIKTYTVINDAAGALANRIYHSTICDDESSACKPNHEAD